MSNLRCSDCGGMPVVTPPEDTVHWCQRCVEAAEWEMAMMGEDRDRPCYFLSETVPALIQQAHMERLGWVKRDADDGD